MKKKSEIRKKFLRYFGTFSVIPVVLFCTISFAYISSNQVKNKKSEVISEMEYVSKELDNLLQDVYRIGKTVSEDEKVHQVLNKTFSSVSERYTYDISLSNELSYVSKYYNTRIDVYIIGENGGLYKSGYNSFKEEEYRDKEWYQSIVNSDDLVWIEPYTGSLIAKTLNKYHLALGVPVINIKTGQATGAVVVELQIDELINYILEEKHGQQFYIVVPNTTMLIENENVKIYEEDRIIAIYEDSLYAYEKDDKKPDNIQQTFNNIAYWKKDFPSKATMEKNGYIFSYYQFEKSNWILVGTIKVLQLYKPLYNIILISVVGTVVLLIIAIFASYSMSKTVTKPILLLKESVANVQEGNLDVRIEKIGNDEIGDLSIQFNKMVISIKELVNRIYEEQKKLHEYELMLLQAQINPHFLYNTLDSLIWLLRMKQLDEAVKMTMALTNFFRTGLNKGKDTISLKEEVLNAESYLTIQQMRYKNKLSFNVSMDSRLEEFLLPKMILQPLVENSIYHGIKGKPNGGFIELKCYKTDDRVIISVTDNGLGISEEQLAYLKKQINKEVNHNSSSYGLINVNERLNLFFGERCQLKIESILGEGTTITIEITEGDNHV